MAVGFWTVQKLLIAKILFFGVSFSSFFAELSFFVLLLCSLSSFLFLHPLLHGYFSIHSSISLYPMIPLIPKFTQLCHSSTSTNTIKAIHLTMHTFVELVGLKIFPQEEKTKCIEHALKVCCRWSYWASRKERQLRLVLNRKISWKRQMHQFIAKYSRLMNSSFLFLIFSLTCYILLVSDLVK